MLSFDPCPSAVPMFPREMLRVFLLASLLVKDDQEAVLCFYKTAKDCVMMFSYTELPNGRSNLTVLREPGR